MVLKRRNELLDQFAKAMCESAGDAPLTESIARINAIALLAGYVLKDLHQQGVDVGSVWQRCSKLTQDTLTLEIMEHGD